MNPLTDAKRALKALDQEYPPNILKTPANKYQMPHESINPPHIQEQGMALVREIKRLKRAAGMRHGTSMRAHRS